MVTKIATGPRALTQAETGVKYAQRQWKDIQHIRRYLEQPESLDDSTEPKDQDPSLTGVLMHLCMQVVMQDTSSIRLYESPIMHYLAVRGVDEKSKSFRVPFFYTPILAAALWISRLIMLEVAVLLEPWPRLELKSKAQVESVPKRIHDLRKKHLCEGSFSPIASILSQLAKGMAFNKLYYSQPNIHWSEDEQTINYMGEPIELGRISNMCYTLMQELQEVMEELTFEADVPSIDLGSIVDSMAWS